MDFGRKVLFAVNAQLLGPDVDVIIRGAIPARAHAQHRGAGYYTICGFGMTETAITSCETT